MEKIVSKFQQSHYVWINPNRLSTMRKMATMRSRNDWESRGNNSAKEIGCAVAPKLHKIAHKTIKIDAIMRYDLFDDDILILEIERKTFS